MGRPKKPESEVLSKTIKIRLSREDRDRLQQVARESRCRSLSDWVRKQLNREPEVELGQTYRRSPRRPIPIRRGYVPVDPRLINQLARIGNNLNQIARALNSREDLDTATIMDALIRAEDAIDAAIPDSRESGLPDAKTCAALEGD